MSFQNRTNGDENQIRQISQKISKEAATISNADLKQILDDLSNLFQNSAENDQQTDLLNEIFTGFFSISPSMLNSIIEHAFFLNLRTNFIRILSRLNNKMPLKDAERFYFWNFNKLLRILSKTKANIDGLVERLTDAKFLKKTAEILTQFSTNDDFQIKLFSNFLRILTTCQNSIETNEFDVLLVPAVQRSTSKQVFISLNNLAQQSRSFNAKEKFYLIEIPNFLLSFRGSKMETIFSENLSKTLSKYEDLFGRLSKSIHRWSRPVFRSLNQTFELFHRICENSPENRRIFSEKSLLIDQILKFVASPMFSDRINANSKVETKFLNSTLNFLLVLLSESEIVEKIQREKLSETLIRFQKSSNSILSENATSILAATAKEEDLKQIENPSELISNVVSSLKNLVESKSSSEKTFETLKSLAQHDQMKDEIVKQNSIPFLLECVNKVVDRSLKILLETLWTLAFSADAAKLLRQDENFLTQIQTMSGKSHDEGLQKTIEGLVWKLIQEPAMLERAAKQNVTVSQDGEKKVGENIPPGETIFEYDMMISYCHADKDLIYKIHEFLLEQGFKIWIDLNHMHGPAMNAMAEAVENSEFVLMCMSESYKKSTYCQAEAEYAFNCKRRIVPLIVRPKYRADGWLGFLLGSRIYIDFGSFDFPTACEKLMNEIRLQRKRPLPSKQGASTNQHTVPTKDDPVVVATAAPTSTKTQQIPDEYKQRKFQVDFQRRPMNRWIETDVLDFLAARKLYELMPLCEKMNGKALQKLVQMCTSQHNRTYSILNDELKDKYQMTLPISTYTRFLSEMDSFSRPVAPPMHIVAPIMAPPQIEHSRSPYDIIVTSNATPAQMLNLVERFLPQLPSKKSLELLY